MLAKIKEELSSIKSEYVFILHSNSDLELDEKRMIGNDMDDIPNSKYSSVETTKEYLALFEHITDGVLSVNEKAKLDNIKKSEKLYKEALTIEIMDKKFEKLNHAIVLNPQNIKARLALGSSYIHIGDEDRGMEFFKRQDV